MDVYKRGLFGVLIIFSVLMSLSFASSALLANYTNITVSVERSANNVLNFTIGAQNENITRVQFIVSGSQIYDSDSFVLDSNGTTASNVFFNSTNQTGEGASLTTIVTWTNTTAEGIINNGTFKNFWFSMHGRSQASSLMSVRLNLTGISGALNDSHQVSFGFTFRFSGYVRNETGALQNATNVSIYKWQEGQNGPPTETFMGSTLSDEVGAFTLSGLSSASSPSYVLKMIYYNESRSATKIGSILPSFPAEMYYPQSFSGGFEFMRPPSLNGTTFYLNPAATINITATNSSDGSNRQLFGYMVMEQGTGFPIASNSMGKVSEVQVVVPTNRRYTVMLGRFNSQFVNGAECDGQFMNDTACGTPPKSNSTINPTVSGQQIDVQLDMRINRVQMYGCVNAQGNSSAITNVTAILPRIMPWTGFVPPMMADTQSINLASALQLNYSDARCPGKIAFYNISLLNSNYLVEFYGRNSSSDVSAEWVGGFQNVSFEGQIAGASNNINITLGRLSGSFVAASPFGGGDANRSKFTIRIQNATGGAITQDKPHVDLYVRNSAFGELTFIVEDFTNGTFTLALPLNSNVKAKIFSNNAPPKEKTVNLSLGELNITLISMQGGDGGLRKINSSGQIERMNITDSSFGVGMRFIRNSENCNIINPPSSCVLSSVDAHGFNPFSALVAGKVNLEMKMKATNVSITFYNFDMFSAKQPPMESVMNNEASGGSSSAPVWEFGSFVPADVYDYAVVSMPYSDSSINDSAPINVSVNSLYDENWGMVWNRSRGDTSLNITTSVDDYIGNSNNRSYNATGYRDLIGSGVSCGADSAVAGSTTSIYCYVNTTSNSIYMRVPHFSGVAPLVSASAPASSSQESSSSSSSSSSGGGVSISTTYSYNDKEFSVYSSIYKSLSAGDKINIKVEGEGHAVILSSLTNTSATINVSSTLQQATLNIGESKKFDLTGDNYYDLLAVLNSVTSGKANLNISYIHEGKNPVVTSVASTTSAPTTTETGGDLEKESQNSTSALDFLIYVIIALAVVVVVVIVYFAVKAYSSKSLNSRVNVLG